MKEPILFSKNLINKFLYKNILKRYFFIHDPEKVHDRMIDLGKIFGKNKAVKKVLSLNYSYSNTVLDQNILGINFKNPIGLAAGFDKNAEITDILPSVGFGFAEVGSITGDVCSGNQKPRLWRLKKEKSLIVNYGLKNKGAEEIAKRLKTKKLEIPIGISIAKTNSKNTVDTQLGINDYVKAFKQFIKIGDYFTINISCPNAFGGQPFTEAKKLEKLLTELDKIKTKKPIFLKLSPDLTKKEIDKIIEVSKKHNIKGFICTNLTKNRDPKIKEHGFKFGGISGKLLEDKANELIKYVYKKTKACPQRSRLRGGRGKFIIIGVGGIFCAEDAYKKIKLGASLVQLVTGMIFEGPSLIGEINYGLVKLLEKDGFTNISQAVGKDNKNSYNS